MHPREYDRSPLQHLDVVCHEGCGGLGAKLDRNYLNLEWGWPALATRRRTGVVAVVAATNNV